MCGTVPRDADADVMDRQHAALVLEGEDARPADRRFEVRAMVERGVVEADPGVIAAGRQLQVIVGAERQLQPLEVGDHLGIGAARLHHDLGEHADAVVDRGGHEQIELPEREGVGHVRLLGRGPVDRAERSHQEGQRGVGRRVRGRRLRVLREYGRDGGDGEHAPGEHGRR